MEEFVDNDKFLKFFRLVEKIGAERDSSLG
jgi:hypothetical protein